MSGPYKLFVLAKPDANSVEITASESQARSWKAHGDRMVTPAEQRRFVYPIEVDEGCEIDVKPEAEYHFSERLGTRLLARAIELAPTLGIDPQEVGKTKDDREQLRAAVEAMREVWAAIEKWQPKSKCDEPGGIVGGQYIYEKELSDVVDTNRPRVTAALAGVGVDEEKERMRAELDDLKRGLMECICRRDA